MRCWACGVDPDDIIEVTTFSGATAQRIPIWPSGDHPHGLAPPSPAELEQAGHEALMRIVGAGHQ